MTADSRARSHFGLAATDAHPAAGDGRTAVRRAIGRLAPILIVLAAAQVLDLVTFAYAVDKWGIQGELGPLGMVYRVAGYWAVAAIKIGMIGVVMLAMVTFGWRNSVTPWRVGLVAAAIGAFGAVTNIAALM